MRFGSKKFLLAALLIVTAFVIAYLHGPPKQSDEELKLMFANHRESLTKLERLFIDDPSLEYASAHTLYRRFRRGSESDSPTPVEYAAIFEQTETLSGSRHAGAELDFLFFPTYLSRLDRSDEFYEEKGYAVFLAPTERVEDVVGAGGMRASVEFKQIADRWYIYQRVYEVKPE